MEKLFQQLIDQQIRTNDLLQQQRQTIQVQYHMLKKQQEQLGLFTDRMEAAENLILKVNECLAVSQEVRAILLDKEAAKIIYRDAVYTQRRVGISESTLLRQQHKGHIEVAGKGADGKKFYTDEAVERLRIIYWGLGKDKLDG